MNENASFALMLLLDSFMAQGITLRGTVNKMVNYLETAHLQKLGLIFTTTEMCSLGLSFNAWCGLISAVTKHFPNHYNLK